MASMEEVDVRIRLKEIINRAAVKGMSKGKVKEIFQKELNEVMGSWEE